MSKLGIGVIGCGNISTTYLTLVPLFKGIEVRAVADINPAAAQEKADEFNVRAQSVDELIRADDIDIVVNLTIPSAHFSTTRKILQAGKHAYSEKPLVLSVEEGQELSALADKNDLRVGSAPDTFLGGAHQQARALIDKGALGDIVSGTAHVMSHGMEHWHPNPDFFFLPGAGPMLDIGPYYVTNLIQLIGPVKQVAALTSAASACRMITSEPRVGETIPVKTPTNIHALLEFEQGATVTLSTSWDVWAHRHENMELYGTNGSIYIPDPNFFGGDVELIDKDGTVLEKPSYEHPFSVPNMDQSDGKIANYRTAGLADMAQAIAQNRAIRCSMEMAVHAVDVMTSVLKSGEQKEFVTVNTTCERPAALSPYDAANLLAQG
ncbi:MAG: oxidoreductase [Rhodobacteraceae bacterium]|nr:oxidoreductase [Paracoccaceae bacterium]